MEPTPEVIAAATSLRQAYVQSPVWAPALEGATMLTPSASVEPLRSQDIHYFLFEFAKGNSITARFAIDQDGDLLEAEAIKRPTAALPRVHAASVQWWAAGRSLRQVWMPCDQSTTRLRPLWEISAHGVTRYIRVDGLVFDRLTTNKGRG